VTKPPDDRPELPEARAARSLFTRELLTVTHSRPNVGLNVCLQLAKVVAVVVNPLVDQIFDLEVTDLVMRAAALEVC
jgi:hypothetical protein